MLASPLQLCLYYLYYCLLQIHNDGPQSTEGGSKSVFSEDEVAEHATKESGVWVTYQGGVYDVTNWVGMSSRHTPAHHNNCMQAMLGRQSSLCLCRRYMLGTANSILLPAMHIQHMLYNVLYHKP